jgi:peroxiredoxin
LRGIQNNLKAFHDAGIKPVAITVDSPETSLDLMRSRGLTFTFLSDPDLGAIKPYDLVHEGMGEDGRDIARPAEFLIDKNGSVQWINLTGNYWVRARPEQILEAAAKLR